MNEHQSKWEQAQQALEASRLLLEADLYRDSISRAYYAMFDAAQTLLRSAGHRTKTHKGVHVLLDKHFVKEDILPEWMSTSIRNAYDMRQLADYSEKQVSRKDAEDVLQNAESFVQTVRDMLNATGEG